MSYRKTLRNAALALALGTTALTPFVLHAQNSTPASGAAVALPLGGPRVGHRQGAGRRRTAA